MITGFKEISVFEPMREFVLERRKSMFTYVVDEDFEFFGLILSFQVTKRVKNELFVLLKKKKDRVLSTRRKLKNIYKMTSFDL